MVLGCDMDELKQRREGICLPFFVAKNLVLRWLRYFIEQTLH
jgi:hypothetical protein